MKYGVSSQRALIALGLLLISSGAVAGGIAVQPNRLDLSTKPGTAVDDEVTISSLTPNPTRLRFSVEGFTLDMEGRPAHRRSVAIAEQIQLSATEAVVAAGQPLHLQVHVSLSADTRGSWWAVLLIDQATDSSPAASGLRLRSRIAVPIFVTAEGTEIRSATIEDLEARALSGTEIVIAARIRNSGNTVLRCPMTLAIESNEHGQTAEIASAEQTEFTILPGEVRIVRMRITGAFQDLLPLSAVVFYRYGDGHDDVASSSSHIAPAQPRLHPRAGSVIS